jgi:hypothetical protein
MLLKALYKIIKLRRAFNQYFSNFEARFAIWLNRSIWIMALWLALLMESAFANYIPPATSNPDKSWFEQPT